MFKLAVFNILHLNSSHIFLCIKLHERLIKIQCAHISKSYLKFQHVPELSYSAHRVINPPPPKKKTPSSLFFDKAPANCPSPSFRQFPIYIVFCDPPPLKIGEPPYYYFSSLTAFYLLKVTKFLVKICQFKFLVMTDEHFGL